MFLDFCPCVLGSGKRTDKDREKEPKKSKKSKRDKKVSVFEAAVHSSYHSDQSDKIHLGKIIFVHFSKMAHQNQEYTFFILSMCAMTSAGFTSLYMSTSCSIRKEESTENVQDPLSPPRSHPLCLDQKKTGKCDFQNI